MKTHKVMTPAKISTRQIHFKWHTMYKRNNQTYSHSKIGELRMLLHQRHSQRATNIINEHDFDVLKYGCLAVRLAQSVGVIVELARWR